MTDEKQIEEMAIVCENCKTSCDKCFDEYEKTIWLNEIKKEDRADHCKAILHAQRLYKAGYRKPLENAVVLTKEEYQNDYSSQFNKGYSHGRKETAREIRNKFRELLSQYCEKMTRGFAFKILDETIKQCGVEVEE